jgi:hypothetical protein
MNQQQQNRSTPYNIKNSPATSKGIFVLTPPGCNPLPDIRQLIRYSFQFVQSVVAFTCLPR